MPNIREKVHVFLQNRANAYKQVFGSENVAVKEVMRDLAKFCRANETCFHVDARAHAVAEGRREVYLRIKDHLDLTTDELLSKLNNSKENHNG